MRGKEDESLEIHPATSMPSKSKVFKSSNGVPEMKAAARAKLFGPAAAFTIHIIEGAIFTRLLFSADVQ